MLAGGGVKTRKGGGGAPGKFIANISCCFFFQKWGLVCHFFVS